MVVAYIIPTSLIFIDPYYMIEDNFYFLGQSFYIGENLTFYNYISQSKIE